LAAEAAAFAMAIAGAEATVGKEPIVNWVLDILKIVHHPMKITMITRGTKTYRQYRTRLYVLGSLDAI
jgi:DNA-binding protein